VASFKMILCSPEHAFKQGFLLPGHCCTSMTSMRYRSVSNVSEADVDSTGEAAAQLSVWGERLLAEARSSSSTELERERSERLDAPELLTREREACDLAVAEEAPEAPERQCRVVQRRRIDCMCGIPAPSYSRGPKFPRACDAGLLEAFPAGSSWSLSLFGTGPLHWFSSSSTSSRREPLRGKVVFWGNLREERLQDLQVELRLALFRVLTSAAGPDVFVDVGGACRRLHSPKAAANGEDCAEFEFEVLPSDPHDMGPVLEVLHLEAEAGGALRLLPLLAECSSAAGSLRLRLDLEDEGLLPQSGMSD